MRLTGSVALIAGGARMGEAIAASLADRGADIVLTYRTSEKSALKAARSIESRGRRSIVIKADLAKRGVAAQVISRIKKVFGRLDILIHMSSVYEEQSLAHLTARDWQRHLETNLTSGYEVALRSVPLMKGSGSGRIIFVTDWTVESGRPRYRNLVPYYVAKSGLKGLTEVLALELAPAILVNSIAPGPILPPRRMSAKAKREVAIETPLRRWGGAEEIAKAVMFLAESDFVTGESIRVDGGRHLR